MTRFKTLVLVAVLFGSTAFADIFNFPKGSLIIPEQSSFQTPCGSLASYGLVYRLLLANQPGGYFDPVAHPGRTPITVYWTVGGTKTSPNRCVPTNKSTPPDGSAWNAIGSPGYNDGCDFAISNSIEQPVTQVDYSINPWTTGLMDGLFPITDLQMRTPTIVGKDVHRTLAGFRYIALTFTGPIGTTFDATTMINGNGYFVLSNGTITVSGTGAGASNVVRIFDSNSTELASSTSNAAGVWSVTVNVSDANTLVPNLPTVAVPGSKVWFSVFPVGINYTAAKTPEAIPAYPKVTALNKASGFTDIQYMGGPFVIHASDAQQVIEFLQNGDGIRTQVPAAAAGAVPARTVDVLAEFTDNLNSVAALKARPSGFFDSCTGPKLTINGLFPSGAPPGTAHYVNMHQALISFSANVSRRLGVAPPKIALLNRQSNGDSTGASSVSGLLILDSYLGNAGLYLTKTLTNVDSGGCPPGTKENCTVNGSNASVKNGGFIYDNIDANGDLVPQAGLPNGILGIKDGAGLNVYGVMWSPHWHTKSNGNNEYSYQSPGGPTGAAAMNNIASFLNLPGKGLMGECSSIGSYEGSGGITAYGAPATNFQFSGKLETNKLKSDEGKWEGMNCTDPNYPNNLTEACTALGATAATCAANVNAAKQGCMVWDNTISEFAQIGDYHFVQASGAISSYKPKSGNTANSATRTLATTWMNYSPGDYPTGGACDTKKDDCDNGWNIFSIGNKDNDATKGTIVYVAGHDYQISTVGSRIILNTLLNLGQQPNYANRAISAPTLYVDKNGARDAAGTTVATPVPLAFSGVYNLVAGVSNSRFNYSYNIGSQWIFPKTTGNVFERPLVDVGAVAAFSVGTSSFNTNVLWDAHGQLGAVYGGNASARNLFTYVGGSIVTNAAYPRGGLQKNWKPAPIQASEVDSAGCVDVLEYDMVNDGKHTPYYGLTPTAGDGVCDVYQSTQLIPVVGNVAATSANKTLLNLPANRDTVKGMLQVVQGYCFATTAKKDGLGIVTTPASTSNCNSPFAPVNRPLMGGVLHSTPAVVGPSPNISDRGAPRPTVVYTAAADGQLHAFYVSGGAGYIGEPLGLSFPNTGAVGAFNTVWASPFVKPLPMTELWSFMPASQLPLLSSNSQLVDSAPVVQDVFADFSNSGVREWHTVLIATAGGPLGNPGSEIFAMDITNPLKPVLLWDMMGTWTGPPGTFSPIAVSNLGPTTLPGALKYVQTKRSAAYPNVGLTTASVFDYSTLGASYGLSLGVTRSGVEPNFPVYLSSNFAQDTANFPFTNGAQVYSIDSATGQIIWHWLQPYAITGNIPGNPVPQPVTLLPDRFGSLSLVYANDMEGNTWELPAKTGINAWTGAGVSSTGAIFATGTPSEPLTAPITIARMPNIPTTSTAALKPWKQNLIALTGTNNAAEGYVNPDGQFHVMNIDPGVRPTTGVAPADNNITLTPFPMTFTARRVAGPISVVGQFAYVSTTSKAISDPLLIDALALGGVFPVDLGAADTSTVTTSLPYFSTQGSYGGVVAMNEPGVGVHVISSQVTQQSHTIITTAGSQPNAQLRVNGPVNNVLYKLTGWVRRVLD